MVLHNVICIGVFDGLHLGHQALIATAKKDACKKNACLSVVTFDKDPDEYFCKASGGFSRKLMTNRDRLHALAKFSDIESAYVLEASEKLFSTSPDDFLLMLKRETNPCSIFVGEGFRFGANNEGDTDTLCSWAQKNDCACNVVPLIECGGLAVSSTRIRKLLEDGDVAQASQLLGKRHHSIYGEVVHGRGEGSGFGFATANLDLEKSEGVILPKEGVYGGYAMAVDENGASLWNKAHACAINVGKAKSFKNAKSELEVHILGIDENLYGATMRIEFVQWLREQRIFKDKDDLIATVTDNINWVRTNLEGGA